MTRLRGRRRITCTECGKETTTRHPTDTRCLPCRAKGKNLADRTPLGLRSKHDLDSWLAAGGAR